MAGSTSVSKSKYQREARLSGHFLKLREIFFTLTKVKTSHCTLWMGCLEIGEKEGGLGSQWGSEGEHRHLDSLAKL